MICMRLKYSTSSPDQNEFDSLPRLPLLLRRENQEIEAIGLVDSGATVNVLPYELGLELGGIWNDRRAIIQLAGNLSSQPAMPFAANAQIGEFSPIELLFAWVKHPNTPLILGQTNFFLEFDVCFYRSNMEFEVKPKSP
jgi:hypothetical protein